MTVAWDELGARWTRCVLPRRVERPASLPGGGTLDAVADAMGAVVPGRWTRVDADALLDALAEVPGITEAINERRRP